MISDIATWVTDERFWLGTVFGVVILGSVSDLNTFIISKLFRFALRRAQKGSDTLIFKMATRALSIAVNERRERRERYEALQIQISALMQLGLTFVLFTDNPTNPKIIAAVILGLIGSINLLRSIYRDFVIRMSDDFAFDVKDGLVVSYAGRPVMTIPTEELVKRELLSRSFAENFAEIKARNSNSPPSATPTDQ